MKDNGKTFLKGALVLAVANLVVKLIGAFLKIPLYSLIGEEGMGLFNVAYQIYTFMFIIATAGFPIAVSKMVAESVARGDETDAKRVFETSLMFLGIIGIAGSLVLFVFADSLAALLHNNAAATAIKMISPSVFFVSLVSAYRGYFQGIQNMYPTAASEVTEAVTKLVAGFAAALIFMNMTVNSSLGAVVDFKAKEIISRDMRTRLAASGAIMGVTLGTLLSLILMMSVYSVLKKRRRLGSEITRGRGAILKELVLIAVPITIGASVSSLTSLVDLATIMNRLVVNPAVFDKYAFMFQKGTEFAKTAAEEGWQGMLLLEKKANSLYGMYTGQAQTMFNLPLTMVVALSMSIVPAISTAVAARRRSEAIGMTESVLRITMLFAMPCAIGMSVLSGPILGLLYGGDTSASLLLQKLSIAVIFVALVSVSNAVLQAYGRVYYPVVNMLIGGAVKVAMNYTFIPVWGIDGAPIATNACYAVIALLNIICIVRILKAKFSITDMVIKPLCASLIMGATAAAVYNVLSGVTGGSRICVLAAIAAGGIIYIFAALALRAFRREDILNMPKGEKIEKILTKYKLL